MVISSLLLGVLLIYLFGVLRRFQHCTDHMTMGSFVGRGNQYIQLVKVVYCTVKQVPTFSHKDRGLIRNVRWEASVLPLRHRGPLLLRVLAHLKIEFISRAKYMLHVTKSECNL